MNKSTPQLAKVNGQALATVRLTTLSNSRRIRLLVTAAEAGPSIIIQPLTLHPGVELGFSIFAYSAGECTLEPLAYTPTAAQVCAVWRLFPTRLDHE